MTRVKSPLQELTDSKVLRIAARRAELEIASAQDERQRRFSRHLAARLRAIARRVPLWTDNRKGA